MLFIVLSIICVIIGIVAVILYKHGPNWACYEDWCSFTAIISFAIAVVIMLTCLVGFLDFNYQEPHLIESMKTDYIVIQANIKRINEDKLPYTWSERITDYNGTIAQHKRNIDNPWVGIFHSKTIAEMEPIDLTQFTGDE